MTDRHHLPALLPTIAGVGCLSRGVASLISEGSEPPVTMHCLWSFHLAIHSYHEVWTHQEIPSCSRSPVSS